MRGSPIDLNRSVDSPLGNCISRYHGSGCRLPEGSHGSLIPETSSGALYPLDCDQSTPRCRLRPEDSGEFQFAELPSREMIASRGIGSSNSGFRGFRSVRLGVLQRQTLFLVSKRKTKSDTTADVLSASTRSLGKTLDNPSTCGMMGAMLFSETLIPEPFPAPERLQS